MLDAPPTSASFARLMAALRVRGVIDDDNRAGASAAWLVSGGFQAARVDEPGRIALYANQQGGFRVRCPACGVNAVPAFNVALRQWRAGGPRTLTCDRCAEPSPLEDLDFRPPAAFGVRALILADVEAIRLTGPGLEFVHTHLGPVHLIARRVT
jgi:hypothetical protein